MMTNNIPPVKGGQGRSGESVEDSASAIVHVMVAALVLCTFWFAFSVWGCCG